MSFIGKFVVNLTGEYLRTGEIIDQPTPEFVLVKFDCSNCHRPHTGAVIFPVSDLLKRDNEGLHEWTFYETRDELDAYLEWLDGEPEGAHAAPASANLN